jgi:hypothetical protein
MYKTPAYFQHEVQLIDRDWFVCWNPRKDRWQVRIWLVDSTQERTPNAAFDIIARKSVAIMTVCFYDDSFTKDIGYKPLDARTLLALKISRRNADNPDAIAHDIDESNARLEAQWDAELDYMMKDAAKHAYKHFHEPSVYLGT